MLEHLKIKVCEAYNAMNCDGSKDEGFVSAFDGNEELIVVPPAFETVKLSYEDMLVIDLDGNVIEGGGDLPIEFIAHARIYENFPQVHSVAQAYFTYSTAFAQAGRGIKAYGTTHAYYFPGIIPCSRKMTPGEIESDYELNTGNVIIETIAPIGADKIHACLVYSHGPFSWGKDAVASVDAAVVLEVVAQMAFNTEILQTAVNANGGIPMQQDLLLKHFNRKHGPNATYGQN